MTQKISEFSRRFPVTNPKTKAITIFYTEISTRKVNFRTKHFFEFYAAEQEFLIIYIKRNFARNSFLSRAAC